MLQNANCRLSRYFMNIVHLYILYILMFQRFPEIWDWSALAKQKSEGLIKQNGMYHNS